MGPKEDPRKAELENGRLGLPPNQSLVSASEVAPTTNAADEVALAVKRAKGGVLQMARVTSEVVLLPLLPVAIVAGRRNGVSATSARSLVKRIIDLNQSDDEGPDFIPQSPLMLPARMPSLMLSLWQDVETCLYL